MRWVVSVIILAFWAAPALADYEAAARYSAAYRGISMVVLVDGQAVFENYPNGGSATQRNPLSSGTRSFMGLIAAAAVQDGLLDLDEPVSQTFPAWVGTPRENITVRQLLNLTSGLTPVGNSLRPPTYAAALRARYGETPGETFNYDETPYQIFGALIARKLEGHSPAAYFYERVLQPFGIEMGRWRRGSDDSPIMSQGARLSAREWAVIGQLILDRGQLNGEPMLSPEAFEEMFQGSTVNPAYGLGIWLARPVDPTFAAATPPLSSTDFWQGSDALPSDLVLAAGAGDQRLYISWERNMVVVRQAEGIGAALRGDRLSWSDVDFWRMLNAPTGEAPSDITSQLPAGLALNAGQNTSQPRRTFTPTLQAQPPRQPRATPAAPIPQNPNAMATEIPDVFRQTPNAVDDATLDMGPSLEEPPAEDVPAEEEDAVVEEDEEGEFIGPSF